MLLDKASERDLRLVIQALASGQAVLLTGETFLDQSPTRELAFPRRDEDRVPILEQAFLAGKVADIVGAKKAKTMNADAVSRYIRENGLYLNETDRAILKGLKADTLRWLEGRSAAWQGKLNEELSKADREFSALTQGKRYNDVAEVIEDRAAFISQIVDKIDDKLLPGFQGEAQRLLQSEAATYFQQGQTASKSDDEWVYKVPRGGACKHCVRIHLNRDGTPRKYRLKDVRGNSNVGLPAAMWRFTIGSTHPYCYCVLHYESQDPASQQVPMAKAFHDHGCGTVPDDMLYEEQLLKHIETASHPAHHEFDSLLKQLTSANS